MTSITIHGLNDPLERLIREKAHHDKTSLNKTIKTLLSEALGLNSFVPKNYKEEFLDLCGIWGVAEGKEFTANTQEFSEVNDEDWK
ncbi:MAG: hypothetical protein H8E38_09600 [SAR324 cluster bacterium]|nr:hypothetical protein [SAR324 cluster bacterium]MBL7035778.1 hypothetical protein [SAR324 cluster bacterium]